MTEALKAAKEAFGPEAVILGVKTRKPASRFLGKWKRSKVALTAATDAPSPGADPVAISKAPVAPDAPSPTPIPHVTGATRKTRQKPGAAIRTFSRSTPPSFTRDTPPAGYVNKLFWIHQQMLKAGVAEETAQELMIHVHTIAARRSHVTEESLMRLLEEAIHDRIRLRPAPDIQPGVTRCMAFVGPTGVGKTTTIAKIATIYAHRRNSSLGLITLDSHRIGGISPLAAYARILGIPLKAATSPLTLRKALKHLSEKELILIDTAGVNPNDMQQIERLDALIKEMDACHIHLVLSTTTRSEDLTHTLDAFGRFPIQNLLFTKIDESSTHGHIMSRSIQSGIPLSYYTDGREVPDDIHVMTAGQMMGMIFTETNLRRAKSAPPELLADRLQAFETALGKNTEVSEPYRTFSAEWPSAAAKFPYHEYSLRSQSNAGR